MDGRPTGPRRARRRPAGSYASFAGLLLAIPPFFGKHESLARHGLWQAERFMGGSFEPEAAIARLGGDLELYRELIQSFLDDSAGLLPRLEAAIAAAEAEAVHKAAHNLKGTAATCGAIAVAEVATELERSGLDRDLSRVNDQFSRLKRAMTEARRELARYYD
jgi:HPt (histidine-containing phosphotransfer) domain-containing protein